MNKELSIPSSPTSGSEAQTFLERNGDDMENGTFRTFRNPCSQGCLSEVTDVSPAPRRSPWEKGRQRGAGERGAGVGAPPGRVCGGSGSSSCDGHTSLPFLSWNLSRNAPSSP